MTTQRDESSVQEAVAFGDPVTRAVTVQARAQRANSVPNALPLPSPLHSADLAGVTQGDVSEGYAAALERAVLAFGRITRGASLLHAHPPSIAEIHERHRESAARYNAALAHWPRRAWGWLHTTVATVFYGVLWAIFSPAGLVVAALAIVVFLFWS